MGRRDFVGVRALSPLRISFSRFYGERPFDVILRLGLLYPYQDNNPGLTHARHFSDRDTPVCVFRPCGHGPNAASGRRALGAAHSADHDSDRGTRSADQPATHARGCRGLARRIHEFCARARRHPGRGRRHRERRPGSPAERLRLCRCGEAEAGRCGADAVPPGLGVKALYLDGRHAAGRARQARPRCRREHLPRLQDPAGTRRRAAHVAKRHDPHAGIRRGGQGTDYREPRTAHPAGRRRQAVDPESHLQGRHDAGVLELRDCARRVHRRTRLGPEL